MVVLNEVMFHILLHKLLSCSFQTMDFTCCETQIGNGDPSDCEVIDLPSDTGFYSVTLPL
jgi:allantoicase